MFTPKDDIRWYATRLKSSERTYGERRALADLGEDVLWATTDERVLQSCSTNARIKGAIMVHDCRNTLCDTPHYEEPIDTGFTDKTIPIECGECNVEIIGMDAMAAL